MSHEALSRRAFVQQSLSSLLTISLVEALCGQDLFADEIKPLTTRWLADLNTLCQDVKGQQLEQVAWQKKVEELYRQVDLPELLKLIDFEKLTSNVDFVDQGARSLRLRLPAGRRDCPRIWSLAGRSSRSRRTARWCRTATTT